MSDVKLDSEAKDEELINKIAHHRLVNWLNVKGNTQGLLNERCPSIANQGVISKLKDKNRRFSIYEGIEVLMAISDESGIIEFINQSTSVMASIIKQNLLRDNSEIIEGIIAKDKEEVRAEAESLIKINEEKYKEAMISEKKQLEEKRKSLSNQFEEKRKEYKKEFELERERLNAEANERLEIEKCKLASEQEQKVKSRIKEELALHALFGIVAGNTAVFTLLKLYKML